MDREVVQRVVNDNVDLLLRKNQDYGNDNLLMTGLPGLVTRLQDKVSRLRHLTSTEAEVNYESIEDTLRDISNYGTIGQLMKEGALQTRPLLVYLAGPIDDVSEEESKPWRRTVATALAMFGISSFDPASAFHVSISDMRQLARKVIEINRRAILESDLVLVNLLGPGRGIGTIREIEYALAHEKTVIAVVDDDAERLSLYDVKVVSDFYQAVTLITGHEVDLSQLAKKVK